MRAATLLACLIGTTVTFPNASLAQARDVGTVFLFLGAKCPGKILGRKVKEIVKINGQHVDGMYLFASLKGNSASTPVLRKGTDNHVHKKGAHPGHDGVLDHTHGLDFSSDQLKGDSALLVGAEKQHGDGNKVTRNHGHTITTDSSGPKDVKISEGSSGEHEHKGGKHDHTSIGFRLCRIVGR